MGEPRWAKLLPRKFWALTLHKGWPCMVISWFICTTLAACLFVYKVLPLQHYIFLQSPSWSGWWMETCLVGGPGGPGGFKPQTISFSARRLGRPRPMDASQWKLGISHRPGLYGLLAQMVHQRPGLCGCGSSDYLESFVDQKPTDLVKQGVLVAFCSQFSCNVSYYETFY